MSRRNSDAALELDALLERGKAIPQAPADARARVLARARRTLAVPPLYQLEEVDAPAPRRFPLRVGAYAVAFVAGVAAAAVALNGVWPRSSERPQAPVTTTLQHPSPVAHDAPAAPGSALPEPTAPEKSTSETQTSIPTPRSARSAHARPSDDAELELLRAAHSAYQAHDFSKALVLVGEHARRFPSGMLAEEREALRVRSLAGAGRIAEARRAAAQFAKHFPRSVLLTKLQNLGLLDE